MITATIYLYWFNTKNEFVPELEATLNVRPFRDAALMNPFLTFGIGGGFYTDKFGAYVPAGLGLQVNFNKCYLSVCAGTI